MEKAIKALRLTWAKISYREIFSIDEIENSKILQALYIAILVSFFVTFYGWVERNTISISTFIKGLHVCPPYFQSCGEYYFLEGLPYGYTQGFFYVLMFLLLLWGIFAAAKRDWVTAHKTIFVALVWKVLFIFVFSYGAGGNFDYYDMALASVWILLPQKEYFAKLVFVTFYFAASTIKIHEGWIFGNYLSSTLPGAPFISDGILPIFTNLVILMQMAGSWFLFSKNPKIQKIAFAYFLLFHMYSGVIVNYRYITISIPALIILFGHNYESLKIQSAKAFLVLALSRQTIAGYCFILCILLTQAIGLLIPGDQKKTLEGNYYGLYMFEANHQCISSADVQYADGSRKRLSSTSTIANHRCDPYQYWYALKTACERDVNVVSVVWRFDHSINGHPFERIVDVPNACTLEYLNFQHNSWIKRDGEAEVLKGAVYKNGFSKHLYPESYIVEADPMQSNLLVYLVRFYWTAWLAILGIVSCVVFASRER